MQPSLLRHNRNWGGGVYLGPLWKVAPGGQVCLQGSNIGPKYCSVPVCKVICLSRERVADLSASSTLASMVEFMEMFTVLSG